MAGTQPGVANAVSFPGTEFGVRIMGTWVADLVAGHPRAADVKLVAVELAANAVLWTYSRGGLFVARVERGQGLLRVTIRDRGSDGKPELKPFALDLDGEADRDGGFGLALVEMLSDSWGCDGDESGHDVWAQWPE